jgi:hypothetical protein
MLALEGTKTERWPRSRAKWPRASLSQWFQAKGLRSDLKDTSSKALSALGAVFASFREFVTVLSPWRGLELEPSRAASKWSRSRLRVHWAQCSITVTYACPRKGNK